MATAPRWRAAACRGALIAFALASAPRAHADPPAAVDSLEQRLASDGYENYSVTRRDGAVLVAFENRRLRSSADAVERVARFAQGENAPLHAFARRLGLVSEQVDWAHGHFYTMYLSDPEFPPPPDGRVLAPTRWHADVDVGPILTYQIGHVFDPIQLRVEIEPRVHLNPWPGAL